MAVVFAHTSYGDMGSMFVETGDVVEMSKFSITPPTQEQLEGISHGALDLLLRRGGLAVTTKSVVSVKADVLRSNWIKVCNGNSEGFVIGDKVKIPTKGELRKALQVLVPIDKDSNKQMILHHDQVNKDKKNPLYEPAKLKDGKPRMLDIMSDDVNMFDLQTALKKYSPASGSGPSTATSSSMEAAVAEEPTSEDKATEEPTSEDKVAEEPTSEVKTTDEKSTKQKKKSGGN
jgi:hypothetical protein